MNDGVNPRAAFVEHKMANLSSNRVQIDKLYLACKKRGAPFTFFRFYRMKNEVRRGRGQIASDWLEACRSGKTNTIRLTRSDDVVINVGLDA